MDETLRCQGTKADQIAVGICRKPLMGKQDNNHGRKINPSDRRGNVMTFKRCGLKDHFYKDCVDVNKKEYREKRLEQIARMKNSKQKHELRLYYTQMHEYDSDLMTEEKEALNYDEERGHNSDEDFRKTSNELNVKFDELMFLEFGELVNDERIDFYKCMNMQTRHVFFGATT